MKKTLLSLALLITLSIAAQAQLSNLNVGLNGNYASYKGDLNKATPGAQLRVGYNFTEKYSASLGFSYGLPMKESGTEDGFDYKSQVQLNTLTFSGMYHLIGSTEDTFSFYIPVGASYVMASSKFTADGVSLEEKSNGFTINAGLGAQYKVGKPIIFAEAGVAIPATSTTAMGQTSYNDNPIPFHSALTIGFKFPLSAD